MLAHLRHAVPGFDALLPRSRARLPELAVMGWHERLTTLVEYWLLGFAGVVVGAAPDRMDCACTPPADD